MLWRRTGEGLDVLLGHNGGPFFARKDEGHWTVLKGEVEPGEDLRAVARREFTEETGHEVPDGPMIELGRIRQRSGKVVMAWAIEGDLDPDTAVSNTFELEWPPGSGRTQAFPEIDRVAWFELPEARRMQAGAGAIPRSTRGITPHSLSRYAGATHTNVDRLSVFGAEKTVQRVVAEGRPCPRALPGGSRKRRSPVVLEVPVALTVEFARDPRCGRKLRVERFPVADTPSDELRPCGHFRDRVGRFR